MDVFFLKMGKIASAAHKISPNMAVRELGMYPLTIDVYARIVNYLFHLLELTGETQLYNQGLLNA